MRALLLSILAGGLVFQTGCAARKPERQADGDAFTRAFAEPLALPFLIAASLGAGLHQFHSVHQRWPQDYAELTAFVNPQSPDEYSPYYQNLTKVQRADFKELPERELDVDVTYSNPAPNPQSSANSFNGTFNFTINPIKP